MAYGCKMRCLVSDPNNVANLLLPEENLNSTSTKTTDCASDNHDDDDDDDDKDVMPFVGPIQISWVSVAINKNQPSQQRQRGVIATRDIKAGELLFAIPPTIQASVSETLQAFWNKNQDNDKDATTKMSQQQQQQQPKPKRTWLEECSEEALLNAMQETLLVSSSSSSSLDKDNKLATAASFSCLTGSTWSQTHILPSMDRLLAISPPLSNIRSLDSSNSKQSTTSQNETLQPPPFTRDDLRQIIRHNAFGPDGLSSYANMERALLSRSKQQQQQQQHDESSMSMTYVPSRLVDIYPLAAMLNHSCLPNAIRVYGRYNYNKNNNSSSSSSSSVMVVHALKDIRQGDEIVWSYIPPTQPWPVRQATLQQHYGFTCQCPRCRCEQEEIYNNNNNSKNLVPQLLLQQYDDHDDELWNNSGQDDINDNDTNSHSNHASAMNVLEEEILQKHCQSATNTVKAYLRVSYLPLYLRYLNHHPSNTTNNKNNNNNNILLLLAMQIHLSCCTAHYASTEHISILHWCYQTVGQWHTSSDNPEKTLPKVRFWTEQLKKAHMVRFGALGNDLETVRQVMRVTRKLVMSPQNACEVTSALLL